MRNKKAPSQGFGDTVAKVLMRVGFESCNGCKKRQAKLNDWFPYRSEDELVIRNTNSPPAPS